MSKNSVVLIIFFCFALALPLWGMQSNKFDKASVSSCTADCYDGWKQETGGVLVIAAAKAEAKAAASPVELGKATYVGCIACHGSGGEGGVGPALAGQAGTAIYDKLVKYKNGETVGSQSALMWSQSAMLSDDDMKNVAAYVETL